MEDAHSPIEVPPSFLRLFVPPGAIKPTAGRQLIAERHEFCEDLAQLLTQTAVARLHELHVTEGDILERVFQGLLGDDAPVTPAEARWVTTRLAELLNWR